MPHPIFWTATCRAGKFGSTMMTSCHMLWITEYYQEQEKEECAQLRSSGADRCLK